MNLYELQLFATLAVLSTPERSYDYDEDAQARNKQRLINERKKAKELAQKKSAKQAKKRKR